MGALDGEVTLVTGGGSGLGRAIVDRFIEEGAQVVVLDRMAEKLASIADAYGDRVATLAGDVRSFADNARAVANALEHFGKLDCAIGNAGIWDYSLPLDATAADSIDKAFDEMFHINVKGYILLAKAALPALAKSRGSLLFTASNAGFDPAGGGVLYTATKHAVVGLIRQLAFEFAPVVRVNGVAPGPIETDLRGPEALGQSDRAIDSIGLAKIAAPGVPLGFVPLAQDYTGGYVMLASRRDNRTTTGAVLRMDTGIGIRGIGVTAMGGRLAAKYGSDGNSA